VPRCSYPPPCFSGLHVSLAQFFRSKFGTLSVFSKNFTTVDAYRSVQWQTTWDRQKLFTRQPTTSGLPINFGPPGPTGSADIVVDDTQIFQTMDGFGATLSEHIPVPSLYFFRSSCVTFDVYHKTCRSIQLGREILIHANVLS